MTRDWFNDFVQRHSRKFFGYAYRILQNQEEAEDAVQEIFIKLWKMEGRLNEYKSIDALAITMTKNYCIDQLRKQKNFQKGDNDLQNYDHITSLSPHEQLEIYESNEIINKIIEKLPEIYKVVIRLRDMEGLSYEEIADKTDQSINTLRVTISRARKTIRDEFNKYQYERRGIEQTTRKVL